MKYIHKKTAPSFFITDTQGLTTWNDYSVTKEMRDKKRHLKEFILKEEQLYLCCYCEKTILLHANSSHIEHIKPKSIDFVSLTFDYSNLIVSCHGNHFNEIGDNSRNTCGHKKDDNFDEIKFLNPTLINDLSDYFVFEIDTGIISASLKDEVKAGYTLQILNLNGKNDKLAEARKKAKESLIKNFSTLSIEVRKKRLRDYLQNDSNEFITFFRYIFRHLN